MKLLFTHKLTKTALALFVSMHLSLGLIAHEELVIIGGGHVGLIQALHAHRQAKKTGKNIHITIYEKNATVNETTAANIWNSHTPDEIVSVVPRGEELKEKLEIPFNLPKGIKVSDVQGVNDSDSAKRFIDAVAIDGKNTALHERRTAALLRLGKAGMKLWQELSENAKKKLKAKFDKSNFHVCSENAGEAGYRVDLL
ncbi:MAG TPA: hypothetical protein VEK06_00140, partial [Myxococcota bacterium]|nr:hypothetical protein [Myxococcota bacterium]